MKQILRSLLPCLCGAIGLAVVSPVLAAELGQRPIKLFLLGGQSNMDGCGRAEELPRNFRKHPEHVVTWDNRKKSWVPLTEDSTAPPSAPGRCAVTERRG